MSTNLNSSPSYDHPSKIRRTLRAFRQLEGVYISRPFDAAELSQFQLRISNGVGKKYECESCARRFASLISLQSHHAMHTSRLEDMEECSDFDNKVPSAVPVAVVESLESPNPVTATGYIANAKSADVTEPTAIVRPTHKYFKGEDDAEWRRQQRILAEHHECSRLDDPVEWEKLQITLAEPHQCSKIEDCANWPKQQRLQAQPVPRDSIIPISSVIDSGVHYSRQSRGSRPLERGSNGVFDDEFYTHRDHRRRSLSLSPVRAPHIEVVVPPTPDAKDSDYIDSDGEFLHADCLGRTSFETMGRIVEESVPETSRGYHDSNTHQWKSTGTLRPKSDLASNLGVENEYNAAENYTRDLLRRLNELKAAAIKHISEIAADEDALQKLNDELLQKLHEVRRNPKADEHKARKKVQILVLISEAKRAAQERRKMSRNRKYEYEEFYTSRESRRRSSGFEEKERTGEGVDPVKNVLADTLLPAGECQTPTSTSPEVGGRDSRTENQGGISVVNVLKSSLYVHLGLSMLCFLLGLFCQRHSKSADTHAIGQKLSNYTISRLAIKWARTIRIRVNHYELITFKS